MFTYNRQSLCLGERKDEMMRHFDLHCDTLNECRKLKASLVQNELNVSVERGMLFDQWVQTFAAFIHDDCRGVKAYRRFLAQVKVLQNAFAQSGNQPSVPLPRLTNNFVFEPSSFICKS